VPGKADQFEARLLDHIFKGGATPALAAISTVYVSLHTTAPSESSAGTEVSGSSYARAAMPAANWSRTNNVISNNQEVVWPTVTTAPYTVLGWNTYDAATAGNRLYWGTITSTTFQVGEVPRIVAGAMTVTED
jgi:hypothetical protein